MKNNLFRTVMEWILITSLAFSGIFFIRFYFRSHELNALNVEFQQEAQKLQQGQAIVNALVADANEYAKNNPSIIPVLESLNVRIKPAAAPAAPAPAPAPKPPGK